MKREHISRVVGALCPGALNRGVRRNRPEILPRQGDDCGLVFYSRHGTHDVGRMPICSSTLQELGY